MAPGTSTAAAAADGAQVEPDCSERNGQAKPSCCPYFHQAVELIGRRWTGAILEILMQGGSLRFSTIAAAVPDLSDRMLSDRLKELESYALVERTVVRRTARARAVRADSARARSSRRRCAS